jgi:FtsH-binding integral membrane protein
LTCLVVIIPIPLGNHKKEFFMRTPQLAGFTAILGASPALYAATDAPDSQRMIQGIVVLLICLVLYFIPAIVGRSKRNRAAIFALNLLLGWTLIGWVVALVWALTVEPAAVERP